MNGPHTWALTKQLFRPASGKPLPEQPAPLATWFGHIGAGNAAGGYAVTDRMLAMFQTSGHPARHAKHGRAKPHPKQR